MQVSIHYFISPSNQEVINELIKFGVSVNVGNNHFSFDIMDNHENYINVLELIEGTEKAKSCRIHYQYRLIYSKEECDAADYLHIHSVFAGIDPIEYDGYNERIHTKGRVHATFLGRNIEGEEFEHWKQIGLTRVDKCPKWSRYRNFCSDYHSALTNLYCSDAAKELIEKNELTGVTFRPVLRKKTEALIPNVWQLWPFECEDFLRPGDGVTTRVCKTCGRTRYEISNGKIWELKVKRRLVPEGLDFFQSPSIVGSSIGFPYYVVSNKAYHVLLDAGITRSVVFTPLRYAE